MVLSDAEDRLFKKTYKTHQSFIQERIIVIFN